MKIFRRMINTLKEAIKNILRNMYLGFVTVTSAFFTFFLIGIVLLIALNARNVSEQVKTKVQDVEVFIKLEATDFEIEKLKNELLAIDIEKSIEFRSENDALDIMKKSWGENADLLDDIDPKNILPSSFIVKVNKIEDVETFVNQARILDSVDEVNYFKDLTNKVSNIANYTQLASVVLILLFMIVSLFIILNTIKLTVYSRSNEIAVMRYVGASSWYIRIPIILEGVFLSLLASGLSFSAVIVLYYYIIKHYSDRLIQNISLLKLTSEREVFIPLLLIMLGLGFIVGYIGSVISIRKYLVKREVDYVK